MFDYTKLDCHREQQSAAFLVIIVSLNQCNNIRLMGEMAIKKFGDTWKLRKEIRNLSK